MSLPEPYYEDEACVLYCADCRDILPELAPGSVDLVLTDPPYGIATIWTGGFSARHGWARAGQQKQLRNEWDETAPSRETLEAVIASGTHAVIWGGNYFHLPPSRGWLVWNKPERNFTLAEAELAWTNRDAVIRVADLPRSDYGRQHPTQKPLRLMTWCLGFFPDARTVFDPFAGSGTTLLAARILGKRAIGIEIEEKYCRIIVDRLAQQVLPLFDSVVHDACDTTGIDRSSCEDHLPFQQTAILETA